MAFSYNSALLAKYHITPPTTWAQFATDAATLHSDDPSAYLTNFAAVDLQWIMSLMAQDNAWPFTYTGGSSVTINWTGPAQMAFAAYWQKMLSAHELNSTTDVSATSFADMDKSIDASWLSSAWGPSYKDLNNALSGTSDPNVAFTSAASHISSDEWPPFMTEALNEASTVFAGVQNGKETLQAAFTNFQSVLVSYAKAQGFTVST
jgi:hypothetical protein